ncbi:DNA/RNA non-specific endonuclease, partial [Klebsiella pneumoniae]|nr:DNA/RNA non-specific endonuclease [Klebsiella pneumoniae]
MKKFLSLSLCLLSAWVAMAQTTTEKLAHSIYLKNGVTVSFDYNQLDSTRIIYTPEGDSLGIKVYVRGKESADYLYSQ